MSTGIRYLVFGLLVFKIDDSFFSSWRRVRRFLVGWQNGLGLSARERVKVEVEQGGTRGGEGGGGDDNVPDQGLGRGSIWGGGGVGGEDVDK